MSAQPAAQTPRARGTSPRGVSLILVMLSMLLLTVLAATIVFTARSETFASYNYKLDTQADYLAKAGIQMAVAWFRSDRYVPVSESLAGTYYNVTPSGPPYNLYTSNTAPVLCIAAAPACPVAGQGVQLMTIPGTGTSNYPNLTNGAGLAVADAFAQDLGGGANATVTADARNSGVVYVNAVLRVYATVNDGRLPNVTPKVLETWYLTSRAVLNGSQAMAEETAVIQPIYVPYYANAMYGYCSVGMTGSAGTCTDAYNSAAGAYGSVPSGGCDAAAPNVIDAGAGVGANGGVSLGPNVVVSGDVTIGSNPSAGCGAAGYNGGGTVLGQVINGPPVDPPPLPSIPGSGQAVVFPGTAPTYTGAVVLPQTSGGAFPPEPNACPPPPGPAPLYLVPGSPATPPHWYADGPPRTVWWDGQGIAHAGAPPGLGWPPTPPAYNASPGDTPTALDTPASPPFSYRFTYPPLATAMPGASPAPGPQLSQPCIAGAVCNGTQSNPYLIKKIDISGGGCTVVTLVGGPDIFHPVYYDIDEISESGQANLRAVGYVVLNVKTNLSITGQGTGNTLSSNPPEAMVINYVGTNAASLSGNGSISAVLIAPNATVNLGGGGSKGYMLGSIQANNVNMNGGYPLHYDIQLSNAGGALGRIITISYNRRKM